MTSKDHVVTCHQCGYDYNIIENGKLSTSVDMLDFTTVYSFISPDLSTDTTYYQVKSRPWNKYKLKATHYYTTNSTGSIVSVGEGKNARGYLGHDLDPIYKDLIIHFHTQYTTNVIGVDRI